MFEFLKKKQNSEPVNNGQVIPPPAPVAATAIADDRFLVMPESFRGGASTASAPGGSRVLIIAGVGILTLFVVGIGAYFVFFSGNEPAPKAPVVLPPVPPSSVPSANEGEETESEATSTLERIITAQSFVNDFDLDGSLTMTIPSALAEQAAAAGITVISQDDIFVPDNTEIIGGLYSLYPVGLTLAGSVSLEIAAADLAAGATLGGIATSTTPLVYPAILRGSAWVPVAGYERTLVGFTFSFAKFPIGQVAIVRELAREPQPVAQEIAARPPASKDTDGDGLTDREESLLGTDPTLLDTDEDSYDDLSELKNGYDPLVPGQSLSASSLFTTYANPVYGYEVSYPAKWLADALDQTNTQVLFISETSEFFEILVEENPLNTPIADWYRSQSPTLQGVDVAAAIVNGYPAVWSPDHLTLYLTNNGLIYIITYNKGALAEINWPNLFELFYNSFTLGSTTAVTAPLAE